MAAVQERGSARCFKDAGWLLFMNKTVARNLGQHTHTHTHLYSTHTHALTHTHTERKPGTFNISGDGSIIEVFIFSG